MVAYMNYEKLKLNLVDPVGYSPWRNQKSYKPQHAVAVLPYLPHIYKICHENNPKCFWNQILFEEERQVQPVLMEHVYSNALSIYDQPPPIRQIHVPLNCSIILAVLQGAVPRVGVGG